MNTDYRFDAYGLTAYGFVMKTRMLGQGGPVTSAIGLGCMGFSQGYGPADDAESIRVIQTALERGVTMIDTAMSYGQGHNERLVGRALAGRREQALVATKFGIVRVAAGVHLDARPERVRADCEASLARLGIDVIDLYYLHRPDPKVPIAETIGAMSRLVEAGLVRHLGVCELTAAQLEQACAVYPIRAAQFEWSLMWRQPETDLVSAARRLGVGLVAYSPLGRGLLTGALAASEIDTSSFRQSDPRFHGEALASNLGQVQALAAFAATLGATPSQLALAWLLAQGNDVVAIPGTRRVDRLLQNIQATEIPLDPVQLREMESRVPGAAWAGDRKSFAVPVTRRGG